MWLIKFFKKVVLPLILITGFSLTCIMFVWNENKFVSDWFSNVKSTWFNVDSNGVASAPKGILGQAVTTWLKNPYAHFQSLNGINFLVLFTKPYLRELAIVYVMPVGVSILFGIVVFTVLSLIWGIIHHFWKKRKSKNQD